MILKYTLGGPICVHVFVLRNKLSTSQPSEALGDSDIAGIGLKQKEEVGKNLSKPIRSQANNGRERVGMVLATITTLIEVRVVNLLVN